jgi:hypothetical protein
VWWFFGQVYVFYLSFKLCYSEVSNEVGNEVWNEVISEVGNEVISEVSSEVWNEVRNEVWNEVISEVSREVSNEVSNEVGNEVSSEVWNEVSNEVISEVSNEVSREVSSEVWNEVSNEVSREVSSEVSREVCNEVWNEVSREVSNEVWNEVWNEVGKSKLTWYAPQYYLSAFNPWVSFYDFFDKECFALKKSKLFNEYKRVLDLNIFWSVPFENFVFVSRNAVKYCRDSQAKLHSVSEPAVQFGGKFRYHLYYIHGVAIKRQMFKKLLKKEYTFQDWVKESNEEVKAAALSFMEEKWGSEYLFRFISDNLKEVDTYTDKKDPKYLAGTTGGMNIGVYTLFKGKIGSINLAFVRCYCPSTDRMFFLCVNAENKTAKDAIASLYRVPAKLKSEIKYIQRQGERFSTVFTDAGKQKLENMTPEEIADLVPVSGEEYFSKMKYEF